jgi:lysophospholipase L1-like esterase
MERCPQREEPNMACRAHPRTPGRILARIGLFVLAGILSGCMINIDHLVPRHGNEGDRLVLRNPKGSQSLPDTLTVRFGQTRPRDILSQTPTEVVVEVPNGLTGNTSVSIWLDGLIPISNLKTFRVDAEPILYRILGFGDSLVGPWIYHTHVLDKMLNENIGPSVVINEGKAGEIMSEGAERLGHVLAIHTGVQYIFLLEGANDVSDQTNTPISEMLASLDQMITLVDSYSLYAMIVTVPPRTREALLNDQAWPTTEDWNDALYNYAFVNGIDLVDLHQAFYTQPDWETFLHEDGLHLSPEGQDFVTEVMYDAIAPLL